MKLDARDSAFDLNFTLIRVFLSIFDTKSVTDTADRLGVTQPSISQHLEKLRSIYSDRLFVRRAGEMVPTLRAQRLEANLRAIMRLADDALCDAAPAGEEGLPKVHLLFEGYLAQTIGPRLIDHLVSNGQAIPSIGALQTKELHDTQAFTDACALLTYSPLPQPVVGFVLLAEFVDPWVIARNRHDAEFTKRFERDAPPQMIGPNDRALSLALQVPVVAECPLEALPLTIAATGLAGLLPQSLARAARVYFDFTIEEYATDATPIPISLHVRQGSLHADGVAELLMATLRQLTAGVSA